MPITMTNHTMRVALSFQEASVLAYQFRAHVLNPHKEWHRSSGTSSVGCPTCDLQATLALKLEDAVRTLDTRQA